MGLPCVMCGWVRGHDPSAFCGRLEERARAERAAAVEATRAALAAGGAAGAARGAAARADRDEAIARGLANADEAWILSALLVVRALARAFPEFTADDVWARVETPREPRALAGVLRRAAADGLIQASGTFRPSARRHAAPVMVWHSLIFGGTA